MSSLISSSGQTGYAVPNGAISITDDGANNLTVAIVTAAGSDPSPTNPLYIAFGNPALPATLYTRIIAYPLKVIIPAGATLGTFDGVACRVWVGAYDVDGTVVLGVTNCNNGVHIQSLVGEQTGLYPAAAISAASDVAQVLYATALISGAPFRLVGQFSYDTLPLTTAGNWSQRAPYRIEMLGPGSPRPGTIVKSVDKTTSGAVASGTTLVPLDDTVPTQSEGDLVIQQAFAPISMTSLLRHRVDLNVAHSLSAQPCIAHLYGDTNPIGAGWNTSPGANVPFPLRIDERSRPASFSSVNYNVYAGGTSGGTLTLNGTGGARKLGGLLSSTYTIEEIWG